MELLLDPMELAAKGVSMPDVVMALHANRMNVVWSSLQEGRLFLLPMINEVVTEEQLRNGLILKCFFVAVFYKSMNAIYLKGVPGQSMTDPEVIQIPRLVTECTSVAHDNLIHYQTSMSDEAFEASGGVVFDRPDELCEWEESMLLEESALRNQPASHPRA